MVWWLFLNFWSKKGVSSSICPALFFTGSRRGEGGAVVARGVYISFLIE
jgi:hypothetical protein